MVMPPGGRAPNLLCPSHEEATMGAKELLNNGELRRATVLGATDFFLSFYVFFFNVSFFNVFFNGS